MADHFTHFSCLIDVGDPERAAQGYEAFIAFRNRAFEASESLSCGFDLSILDDATGSRLWIRDSDTGDVEAVIKFVLHLADLLDLSGLWGFEYALTCSRPRLEAFGGGANVIDLGARKSIGWTSTQDWLAAALNGEDAHA
mgnify:CR=1 FL=1